MNTEEREKEKKKGRRETEETKAKESASCPKSYASFKEWRLSPSYIEVVKVRNGIRFLGQSGS